MPPLERFHEWFAEATEKEPNDPNGMALATATPEGRPSLRMVLLKGADERGFVFYTNMESRKGGELIANPQAALLFHWKSLRRQVRVEGPVEPVTEAEADEYFRSRPRNSRIGAWASAQSRPMGSKAELVARVAKLTAKYAGREVPRPPHWTGRRLVPERFEFWKDGEFRLHDRLIYERDGDGWKTDVLYP